MLVFMQALVFNGAKTVQVLVGKREFSMRDVYDEDTVQNLLNSSPEGTKINVSYKVYGYGEGDKYDADKDELNFIKRLMKSNPETFASVSKVLDSGELILLRD